MFSLQQVIKATASANSGVGGATDLYKFLRAAATRGVTSSATPAATAAAAGEATTTNTNAAITQTQPQPQPKQSSQATTATLTVSSEFNFSDGVSHNSPAIAHGCCRSESKSKPKTESAHDVNPTTKQFLRNLLQQQQHIQDLQQQRFIHSKCSSQDSAKSLPHQPPQQQQQQTTKFAMSSLAAEPLQQAEISAVDGVNTVAAGTEATNAAGTSCHEAAAAASSAGKKPCFNTGLADILQFMELIGNLKVSTLIGAETRFSLTLSLPLFSTSIDFSLKQQPQWEPVAIVIFSLMIHVLSP